MSKIWDNHLQAQDIVDAKIEEILQNYFGDKATIIKPLERQRLMDKRTYRSRKPVVTWAGNVVKCPAVEFGHPALHEAQYEVEIAVDASDVEDLDAAKNVRNYVSDILNQVMLADWGGVDYIDSRPQEQTFNLHNRQRFATVGMIEFRYNIYPKLES